MSDKENNKFSASGLRLFSFQEDTRIGTKIMRHKEIGTIDSWGPFFRISFDLIIHSFHKDGQITYLLAFKGLREFGLLLILQSTARRIVFLNMWSQPYQPFFFNVESNHWYNIIIEQKSLNEKVMRLLMMSSSPTQKFYRQLLQLTGK